MATITAVGLQAAYPEWANAKAAVISNAVAVANALLLDLYTDDDEDTDRRYLEASSNLFNLPFARDMRRSDTGPDPYRAEASRRDVLKGIAYRAPGWTIPPGAV